MPVYDQSYGHWDGEFRKTRFRWLPMVRYHVQMLMKKRLVWLLIFMSFVPAIGLSIPVYITSNQAGDSTVELTNQIRLLLSAFDNGQLDESLTENSGDQEIVALNDVYWLAARYVLQIFVIQFQSIVVLIITSVVGAGLIARDIRSNALEIYLTKPITAVDYVLGKLSVIGVFVFLVVFLPGFALWTVAGSLWPGFFGATYKVLLPFTAFCLVVAVVNGIVILGLSSLAKSSRYAAGIWFALCFITAVVGNTLFFTTFNGTLELISYRESFRGVAEVFFNTRPWAEIFLDERQRDAMTAAPRWLPFAILSGYVVMSLLILRRTIRNLENR